MPQTHRRLKIQKKISSGQLSLDSSGVASADEAPPPFSFTNLRDDVIFILKLFRVFQFESLSKIRCCSNMFKFTTHKHHPPSHRTLLPKSMYPSPRNLSPPPLPSFPYPSSNPAPCTLPTLKPIALQPFETPTKPSHPKLDCLPTCQSSSVSARSPSPSRCG